MAKKNLKKSDIVIGDKSYNFHKIIWEDITGDSTIASSDDFNKMKTIYGLLPLTQMMGILAIET